MKQGFSFLLVFFAISCFAQTGALRLSMDVWPPFTIVEGEKSIASEIVETALERVNISSSSTVWVVKMIRKDTPNAESIIALFNEEVKMMIAEGIYNELLGLDWIRADINGDGTMEIVFSGEAAGTEPPEYAYNVHASDAGDTDQFYIGGNYYNSWEELTPMITG